MMQRRQFFRLWFLAVAFTAAAAMEPPSQPTVLPPEQAAKEGHALVGEILSQKPSQNTTNTGIMTIRGADNRRTQVPIKFEVFETSSNWISDYSTPGADRSNYWKLIVVHSDAQPNRYVVPNINPPATDTNRFFNLKSEQIFAPFVPGSDFWIADLGLEFFHWPEQRLIKKEMKRSRSCKVLESINPHPVPGAYSRVVSWIDNESDGIVMAQAYDSRGKLLKEFIPKKVEKVEGQWQLKEMEIDNAQTGSSTRVDFDLDH